MYEKIVNNNTKSYLYIGFVINKIIADPQSTTALAISELQLFGREEIKLLSEERQYPPKAFNRKSNETFITYLQQNNVLYETITLNPNNINYGIGTYEIYSSTTNGNFINSFPKSFYLIIT
jgi:hypothetical protein